MRFTTTKEMIESIFDKYINSYPNKPEFQQILENVKDEVLGK
jgi:hypothetical protein